MKSIIKVFIVFLFSLTLSASGCDKPQDAGSGGIVSIKLNHETLSLEPGESVLVKAWPMPSMAHAPSFQWVSSDPKVATVQAGVVCAVAPGNAVIKASYQEIVAEVKVEVKKVDYGSKALLYGIHPSSLDAGGYPDLQLGSAGKLTEEGIELSTPGAIVKLDRYYALAERVVEYLVSFGADTKAVFQSSQGDFKAYVDMQEKRISINTSPVVEIAVPFLQAGRDYLLEIFHIYNTAKVCITDIATGEKVVLSAVNDGSGGCGAGAVQQGFGVGMQWDHYCFGLEKGGAFRIKRINVFSLKKSVKLLIYGDSISQPEGYYPSADFPNSWTQRVINALSGNAMSSGRGGGTIIEVLNYIKNELPFINTEYVMVTIGTNGGNTEENLTELMQYIKSQGCTPILNNIPSNESGTQVSCNALISSVRDKLGIKGCLFDIATSEKGDGQTVDKSLMFWEDYSGSYGWQIYHHPNSNGGEKMFERTRIDLPELYN